MSADTLRAKISLISSSLLVTYLEGQAAQWASASGVLTRWWPCLLVLHASSYNPYPYPHHPKNFHFPISFFIDLLA